LAFISSWTLSSEWLLVFSLDQRWEIQHGCWGWRSRRRIPGLVHRCGGAVNPKPEKVIRQPLKLHFRLFLRNKFPHLGQHGLGLAFKLLQMRIYTRWVTLYQNLHSASIQRAAGQPWHQVKRNHRD